MFGKEHDHVEDDAFKLLFEKYRNGLYGYVLAISHSTYTAEEITQEIFIKLWLCRDILHQVENLDGYIFMIARQIAAPGIAATGRAGK
jgi:DNA-directed RNA polymerase specialized sigma24 family protein